MSLGNADQRRALLARALQARPDEAECQRCLNQLDDYVAAQLAGDDEAARFPEVAFHLDACVECAGAYARLYELALAEAANQLPQPDRAPAPDLSFLRPSPLTALAEKIRSAVRRAGERFTLQLSADLLPLLRPAPVFAPVRARTAEERYAEVLLTLEPDETLRRDLPFALVAYRDAQQPDLCLLEITVQPLGQSWPDLAGIGVAITIAGQRREAVTDAWGLASLEGVPVAALPELLVEVVM